MIAWTILNATVTYAQPIDPAEVPTTLPSEVVGFIADPAIRENSGVAASRRFPGVYWTVNDSNNNRQLFAIDSTGATVGTFDLGFANIDWEDIAIDDAGGLYVADVGNNLLKRREVVVYRVDEPDPRGPTPRAPLAATARWALRYPGEPFDCEALAVWDGHGYLVDKRVDAGRASLYRFDLAATEPQTIERIAEIGVRGPVTAMDVAPDGRRLTILTVLGPLLYEVDGDPARVATAAPRAVTFVQPDMEAVCFTPTGDLLATTESRHVLLFTRNRFETPVKD